MSAQRNISANFAHSRPESTEGSLAVIRSLSAADPVLPGAAGPETVDQDAGSVLEALAVRAQRPGRGPQQVIGFLSWGSWTIER
jgi:hypothetical protein